MREIGVRRYWWVLALLGVTAAWGISFPVVKCALERCPQIDGGFGLGSIERPTEPFLFLSLRFLIAALLVGAASFRTLRRLNRRQVLVGCGIGLALCAGYVFQTLGLERTTASNAGLLTGLYVVLTPILGAAVHRLFPSWTTTAGALLAFTGLFLIAAPSGIRIGLGDGLVVVCAFCFAVHLVLLGRFAGSAPVAALVALQLGVTAVVTGMLSLATERAPLPTESGIWFAIVGTAILATVVAFFIQTAAQRFIPPSRTAVILTMESPMAALFGFVMLGERLTARGWAGAALIVAGMLVAELMARSAEAV
ncbi:MAG TPA: DMT family transporter [Actinomycetota bacterium]|nr:DMT family transporter [Actinomycetota bacterium]